jgi:hypothetical protein
MGNVPGFHLGIRRYLPSGCPQLFYSYGPPLCFGFV